MNVSSDGKFMTVDMKSSTPPLLQGAELIEQGSEAKLYRGKFQARPAIFKYRFSKAYRHPQLDKPLRTSRTRSEMRALSKCQEIGIKCPAVYSVDTHENIIVMEEIEKSITVKQFINNMLNSSKDVEKLLLPLYEKIGRDIAVMHDNDLVHGDLITTNMLLKNFPSTLEENSNFDLYFIDFGLSTRGANNEEKAVDIYVLERVILSSHADTKLFLTAVLDSYFETLQKNKEFVKLKLNDVRQRGRKLSMVG